MHDKKDFAIGVEPFVSALEMILDGGRMYTEARDFFVFVQPHPSDNGMGEIYGYSLTSKNRLIFPPRGLVDLMSINNWLVEKDWSIDKGVEIVPRETPTIETIHGVCRNFTTNTDMKIEVKKPENVESPPQEVVWYNIHECLPCFDRPVRLYMKIGTFAEGDDHEIHFSATGVLPKGKNWCWIVKNPSLELQIRFKQMNAEILKWTYDDMHTKAYAGQVVETPSPAIPE